MIMQRLAEFALRNYKRWLSPALPAACRYVPTCSEFAAEAVAHHGAWRGGLLAVWRVLRCHPLARGGYDPVPLGNEMPGIKQETSEQVLEKYLNRERKTTYS